MHFLFVSDFSPNENSGSAGSLLAIGEALRRRGHGVDYLWRSNRPYRFPHTSVQRLFELPRRQYAQVASQLEKAKYDVVIISQPYAYSIYEKLAPRYPKTLFLNRTHGWEDRFNLARRRFRLDLGKSYSHRIATRVTSAMTRTACVRTARSCHGIISPSRKGAEFIVNSYGIPREKVAVIPYGLGAEFLDNGFSREDAGDMVRLLFVGNYLSRKGSIVLESLLPSLAEAYQNATVTFVVPLEQEDRVRSQFQPAFGDRLAVLAWRDRKDLPTVYSKHDVLLFPSIFEGFGKAFLEAMACGLCVVGFDEGGLPDLAVSGTQAVFCGTGDQAAFRTLLEGCLRDPSRTREIGRNARSLALQYSWGRTAEETELFCLKVASRVLEAPAL